MDGSPPPDLDPIWFSAWAIVVWCAVCAALSLIGGWYSLSRLYPAKNSAPGEVFRFASMKLGLGLFPLSYGSCVTIQVGTEGIALSVFPVLRVLHPPLFIPWSAVSDCKEEKFWFFTHTALHLTEPKTRLLFRGRVGIAVRDYWERYRVSRNST